LQVTSNVPLNKAQIKQLGEHYFKTPSALPLDIQIACKKSDTGAKMLTTKGTWLRFSPFEIVAAMLSSFARDVRASADDEILVRWKMHALSTKFTFKLIEGEDTLHFAALQLREDLGANYAGMRYSTLMKIYDIDQFMKKSTGTQGPQMSVIVRLLVFMFFAEVHPTRFS
jgi:hypothetical protein